MEKFNCLVLGWDDMSRLVDRASESIMKSDFHPDVIVGISRGGLVPARLFCDNLMVKSCFSLKVDHWGLTATKDGAAKLTHPLNKDLTGMRVLLVDDITDTGQSIQLARDHLITCNPKEVRTATLYNLVGSKFKPDFCGEEKEWSWMIFPWNFKEDMVNIIKKINEGSDVSVDRIKSELKSGYGIDMDNSGIKNILGHIGYLAKVGK